ncbi:MAG TPA: hypothetical protein VLM80_08370 [Anaerolineales bacterium]|nr:hypothetical protein [Anaerolineales bacterium]
MENTDRFDQSSQALEDGSANSKTVSDQGQVTKQSAKSEQQRFMIFAIIFVVLVLVGIIASVYFLVQPTTDTAKIRDVFIIFMAIESLLIGIALVILMVQLARLINLMQNEIKPILDSTQDALGHLRGTTVFLSDNLVAPVLKLNEYMAGFSQFFQVIGLAKKSKKTKTPKGE